jgi:hypothetical protein
MRTSTEGGGSFVTLFCGATAAMPFASPAHDAKRLRKIGVFVNHLSENEKGQARIKAFAQKAPMGRASFAPEREFATVRLRCLTALRSAAQQP